MVERCAAVDIGTNTLLLLVAERSGSEIKIIADEVRFGRLGKGLDASGNLASESIERSLAAIRDYRAILDEHGIEHVRAVGTQALREAGNAALFRAPAEELLGCEIEIIPGDREAELVATAVRHQFAARAAGDLLVADVGGGSTEVIRIEGGDVHSFRSIPIGSVRMTERHLTADPPTPDQIRSAAEDIDRHLATFDLPTGGVVIGTAGTATTLAAIDLRLPEFDRSAVHGHEMTGPRIDRLLARLLEVDVANRKRLPGLEPERADVIIGGALIFSRLVAQTQAEAFIVADCGVRWGLAYEMLGAL